MSKSKVTLRVPNNVEQSIEEYQDAESLEYKSEAVKQLLQAGVDAQQGHGPGERLAETATGVSAVGAGVTLLSALSGVGYAWGLVVPFLGATFLFSILLASTRVMAGKPLL